MNKQASILHYQKAPSLAQSDIAASVLKSSPLAASGMSFEEFALREKIEKEHPEIKGMDRKELRAFFARQEREIRRDMEDIRPKRERLERLQKMQHSLEEVCIWSAESGLKIERPDGPSFRKLRKAVSEGRTICLSKDLNAEINAVDFEKEVFRNAEILVIEHDWAAAFSGSNIESATVRLPYDVCAFEFKFAGRAVIAFAIQDGQDIVFCPAIVCDDVWVMTDFVLSIDYDPCDERIACIELIDAIAEQIKAACIALDAEVAKSEAVREPYASAGKGVALPPKPYHVVSLARRTGRLQPTGGGDTGRRVRLHFRRGHWRHFEASKTWIKWMLVGDPDLGFVEKEYRL